MILTLLAVTLLSATNELQLALLMKAQADFDRVDLSAVPQFPETSACVLSQAALLPVSTAADLPLVHYRKGYCTLAGATITHNPSLYAEATAEFQKAIDAWPARAALQPKKSPPAPLPAALPVLAAIARLLPSPADPAVVTAAQKQIAGALASHSCASGVMPEAACQADLQLGREWLGWIALSHNNLTEAAHAFTAFPDSGWPAWVAGLQAFQAGNYREAVAQYRSASDVWQRPRTGALGPPADLGLAFTFLGGAQLLSGDFAGAITTLDRAVKSDPSQASTFYYRARAKELAGRTDAALADYNLASRTAFAATVDLASGEAHLYRGIANYRRKDFARAEDEFSSALNFAIPETLRTDVVAWRRLAAVAAGSCGPSRELLARDLLAVSPFFPKGEADSLMAACPTTSSAK